MRTHRQIGGNLIIPAGPHVEQICTWVDDHIVAVQSSPRARMGDIITLKEGREKEIWKRMGERGEGGGGCERERMKYPRFN